MTHTSPGPDLATQLPVKTASLDPSLLPIPRRNAFAGGNGLRDLSSSRTFAPGSSAPIPSGLLFGGGSSSAAGAGSGFFFSGVAAQPALAPLYVPHVMWTLRTFARSRASEPFVLLLERPG